MSSFEHTAPSRESRYLRDKIETVESFLSFTQGEKFPAWPLEVFLEVSNVCDLKCAMCTYFSGINPSRLVAIKQSARGFFDKDATAGNLDHILRHALSIHCYGFGEPTIHPQFREFLAYALQFEAMVDFFTNGMHLTDDLASFLVDQRVSCVTLSFSGTTQEEYEAVYLGGKFEKVLAGIKNLSDRKRAVGAKYPLIAINSIAFRHHVEKLETFVDLMADCGANVIFVKQLVPYPEIPELYGHASILRPRVEGEILARAERRANERGLLFDAADYAGNAVRSEEEYRTRLAGWEAELRKIGCEKLPSVPIHNFEALARRAVFVRSHGEVGSPAAPAQPTSTVALRAFHDLGHVNTVKEGRTFYCMEPFKTLYVRRNGEVKPCCFGHDEAPFLGNVRETPAVGIWGGLQYDTVRTAIVNGEYPRKLCGVCLKHGMAPLTHSAAHRAYEYEQWWRDRFGALPFGENGLSQWIQPLAEAGDGAAIVDRFFSRGSPLLRVTDEEKVMEALLGVARLFPAICSGLDHVVDGYLDRATAESVEGWVWSPVFPFVRLRVTIWIGKIAVAEGVANGFRGDLVEAGKGDGRYAFHLRLDADRVKEAMATGAMQARVTIADTGCELYRSPAHLTLRA